MRGPRACLAEVAERLDDAAAEMLFPEAIDQDASRQRMIGLSKPACEGQPPSCLLCARPGRFYVKRRLAVSQHRRNARTDEPTGIEVIAAAIDVSRRRLAPVP